MIDLLIDENHQTSIFEDDKQGNVIIEDENL